MHIVERAKNIMMSAGAEWVMWLLIAMSIVSVAIIVERILALRVVRTDLSSVRSDMIRALREGGFEKARALLSGSRHPAVLVALRGLEGSEADATPEQVGEAMAAESVAQKRGLERRFSFLATLGANAPFIGLFGTVVGILEAFDALGHSAVAGASAGIAPQAVMSSIAEALVATAIGLGVAIPAVFAFNLFQRAVSSALDDAQMLSLEIQSYLQSRGGRANLAHLREPASRSAHASAAKIAPALS